jgi:hypothetical protein
MPPKAKKMTKAELIQLYQMGRRPEAGKDDSKKDKKSKKTAKKTDDAVPRAEGHQLCLEEVDFVAVNCDESTGEAYWIAQLRQDVFSHVALTSPINCTWLEKQPSGSYEPGGDDTVEAGAIICRVELECILQGGSTSFKVAAAQHKRVRLFGNTNTIC